jgi:hypothetical protein
MGYYIALPRLEIATFHEMAIPTINNTPITLRFPRVNIGG